MLELDRVRDLDTAKKLLASLDRECEASHARVRELLRQIAEMKGGDPSQAILAELALLQARNAQLERMTFGPSSERRLDEDAEPEPPAPQAKRKGHGPRAQPQLPIVDVVHQLSSDERQCNACGKERAELPGQQEISEEVTVIRRHYEIIRHRRQKYLCACDEKPIVTAPGPIKLIEGGRYSVDFAIEVACDKYLNHLPLDRQRKMMSREGLDVTTATLWDQVEGVAAALMPVHEALHRFVLGSPLVHADETRWKLIRAPETETWQAWGIASPRAVCYRILPSRSAEAGRKMLGDYTGVVMVDGYMAYETIARGSPGMSLAHCWAHVRRKYVDIEHFYPAECKVALGLIRELYAIEAPLPGWAELAGDDLVRVLDVRRSERRERSAPVLKKILEWVATLRVTKESALRKAVEYMTERWAGLTRFIDDPRVPLDNNLLERALRPVAMGRKNHLGSKSERGIAASAILYSAIESAKLAGVEPRAYVRAAVHAALEKPRRVLLPHDLKH
jgi:transposase